MKNPIVGILIFFVIGLLYGQYFAPWAYTVLFIVISIALVYSLLNKNIIGIFFIFGFVAGIAIMNINTEKDLFPEIVNTNKKVQVTGTIISAGYANSESGKYIVDVDEIKNGSKIYNDKCRVCVYGEKGLYIGDTIKAVGKLKTPEIKKNPFDFDNYHYSKIKRIDYTMSGKIKYILTNEESPYLKIDKLRKNIYSVIHIISPKSKRGIIAAMVLGYKDDISDSIYDLYRSAGVAHILAISGLHISIFAGIILFLLNKFNRKMASFVLIVFMAFYCVITGCAASTIRAVTMIYVLQFGYMFYRKYNLIGSTAFACLALLIFNPYYIYDIGFQYSFGCVFTIGMAFEIIKEYKIEDKFARLFIVTFLIGVTSKLITVYHFYSFNPIDTVSNMIIVPCVSFVLPICLLAIAVGCFSIHLGAIALKPAVMAFDFFDIVCKVVTGTPFSKYTIGAVPLLTIITMFLIVIFLYKFALTRQLIYVVPIILCIFLCRIKPNEYNRIDVLSADKAECIVIRDRDYVGVINGGKYGNSATGEKVIVSYMKYYNVKNIDDIFITSSENYVIGGIPDLLKNVNVKNIYIPKNVKKTEKLQDILDLAKKNNVSIHYVLKDEELKAVENLKYKCYYIGSGKYGKYGIKVALDDVTFLIPFNISNKYERDFYKRCIQSDVLLLSKSGSKKVNSQDFISAVKPKNAIVSTSSEDYSEKEVLGILNNYKINLYNTKADGMITIKTVDKGYEIEKYVGGDIFAEFR